MTTLDPMLQKLDALRGTRQIVEFVGVTLGHVFKAPRDPAGGQLGPGLLDIRPLVLLPPDHTHIDPGHHHDHQQPLRPLGLEPLNELLVYSALGELGVLDFLETFAVHRRFGGLEVWRLGGFRCLC